MSQFDQFLITELVRRHELSEGPIADTRVISEINAAKPTLALADKVHRRASVLAEAHNMQPRLTDWHSSRRILYALLAIIAVVSGIVLARTSIAGSEPISIAMMLIALLGLNLFMLMVWLVLAVFSGNGGGIGGSLLQGLQQYLFRHNKAQGLLTGVAVANQQRLLKPAMATLAHGFWAVLLFATFVSLYLLLVVNQYSFQWQTTLLNERQVAAIANGLSWLPALLKLNIPSAQVLLDNTLHNHNSEVGRWLLAMLLLYGVAPRILLAMGSFIFFRISLAKMQLDLQAPGISQLRLRLQPTSSSAEIIDADPGDVSTSLQRGKPKHFGRGELVLSLDYESEPDWNHTLWLNSVGVVASSDDRKALLADLATHTPARILVRINSQLSPDRGSLRFIQRLQEQCGSLNAWIIGQGPYFEHWSEALAEIRVPLFTMPEEAIRWAQGQY